MTTNVKYCLEPVAIVTGKMTRWLFLPNQRKFFSEPLIFLYYFFFQEIQGFVKNNVIFTALGTLSPGASTDASAQHSLTVFTCFSVELFLILKGPGQSRVAAPVVDQYNLYPFGHNVVHSRCPFRQRCLDI